VEQRKIAHLPEYAAASEALDRLIHAIQQSGIRMLQAEWLETLTDMATALPYSDCCLNCHETTDEGIPPTPAPVVTDVSDGWLTGTYRCPRCGHVWNCGWAVIAPAFIDS
jgi:hypothetical protein